jgi:hypothetical protein
MYAERNQHLFMEGDLTRTLDAHLAKVDEEVNNIPKNQFLFSRDQDIIDHIYSKIVVNPIELHLDSQEIETEEIQINYESRRGRSIYDVGRTIGIPGNRIIVTIPFSGDHILWKLKPSSWSSVFPLGVIRTTGKNDNGFIDIIFEVRSGTPPEEIKHELDRNIGLIKDYLNNQLRDINPRNERLPELIRQAIIKRRERLEKQEGLIKHLNIPLKSKDGTPPIRPIQVERRIVHQLPTPPKGGYKPEWAISDSDYEDILTIIRHEGRTFESTPSTYAVHDEEDLRNILLAHLNGHYKGGASGETFRKSGKTDICIEMENRAAFIAECKVWRGSQELLSALDQLLGYLTWLDGKTALVLFNKHNAKFSEIVEKVPNTIQGHSKLLKTLDERNPGEWRYKFASLEDENRHITIHVFLFNLYVK